MFALTPTLIMFINAISTHISFPCQCIVHNVFFNTDHILFTNHTHLSHFVVFTLSLTSQFNIYSFGYVNCNQRGRRVQCFNRLPLQCFLLIDDRSSPKNSGPKNRSSDSIYNPIVSMYCTKLRFPTNRQTSFNSFRLYFWPADF